MTDFRANRPEAQRSRFGAERRSDAASEVPALAGNEGYEVRDDEDAIAGRALDLADKLM